jgi:phospholipid N-methyltransferase
VNGEKKNQAAIFWEYCRNAREIGSIVTDSTTCVNTLLRGVPFPRTEIIIEFGSASGKVSREIIKRKRPETLFISFEKNRNLHGQLKENLTGENVYLLNEDAFACKKVITDVFGLKEKSIDCIVSTLPCSCIDFDGLLRRSVLPVLKETGCFVQYTHTLSLLKGFSLEDMLGEHFTDLHSDFVLRNIPPALVYTCRAPRTIRRK